MKSRIAGCVRRLMMVWMGVLVVALAGLSPHVSAHEMSMADLTLRETGKGEFVWAWGVPGKNKPVAEDLTPRWPEGCIAAAQTLSCAEGLVGNLSVWTYPDITDTRGLHFQFAF